MCGGGRAGVGAWGVGEQVGKAREQNVQTRSQQNCRPAPSPAVALYCKLRGHPVLGSLGRRVGSPRSCPPRPEEPSRAQQVQARE